MSQENQPEPKIHHSESGKYTLTVHNVATRPGAWNYTRGVVTCGGRTIAEIDANFHQFPYLFVESHPTTGRDYLICCSNYQGQTVIDLESGIRKDFLPEEAKKGHGFCWADFSFNKAQQLMVVSGCIWACPYEYRFYDFSNPMEKGWPELESEECLYDEGIPPLLTEEGIITTYEAREKGELEGQDAYSEEYEETKVSVASTTFKREGPSLVEISHWIDPIEKARREESEAARKEWNRKWEEYKASDPLFLHMLERIKQENFSTDEYVSIGQCYDGWHPTLRFEQSKDKNNRPYYESRICRRLTARPSTAKPSNDIVTIDLEFGKETAPIQLTVFDETGNNAQHFWFEHSIAGMNEAFDFAVSKRKLKS